MNTIKRDVYVLRNTIKIPIEVTKGTDAISFEFTVRDYNLPATAAAVAYVYRKGMKKPNSTLCDVSGNVISFQPSANFFEVGNNELQIRVINEDKSLISFKEKVKCSDSMGFPDEEEETDRSLIEQIIAQSGKESGERKAADAQERAERIEADAKEKSERQKEIATERARIDQLTKMGEGSTTGDAELQDIRVGADGKIYETAGTAVREQIGSLNEDIDNVEDVLDSIPYQIFDDYLYPNYYLEKNGQYTHAVGYNATKVYPVPPHTTIFFSANVNSGERTLNNIARNLVVYGNENRTPLINAYDFQNAYTNETNETVYIQASIYSEANPTYKVKNLMIQYGTPEILPYKKYGALRSFKIENLEKTILYNYDLMGVGDSLMAGTGGEGVNITKECASILELKSYGVFGFGGSLTKDIGFTFGAFSGYIEPNKTTFKIKNADLTADIWIANNQLNGKTVIVDGKEYIVKQTAKDTFSLNGYTPQNIYVPIHTKESEYTSNVYLIWCGTNDRGYKWDYLETIAKRIPNNKYVVLGLTKYGTDTTVASEAIGMNTFGSHFFNTRLQVINNAFNVLGIKPTEEDIEKMNNGLMPPSLLSDETHFNANGYKAIGILLAKHIESLNYFN